MCLSRNLADKPLKCAPQKSINLRNTCNIALSYGTFFSSADKQNGSIVN